MNERLQSASDESYKDLTNVRSKLIKHAAFEAELEANKTKIDALKKVWCKYRICPKVFFVVVGFILLSLTVYYLF